MKQGGLLFSGPPGIHGFVAFVIISLMHPLLLHLPVCDMKILEGAHESAYLRQVRSFNCFGAISI